MKIDKILNNSVVLTKDENAKEIVVMGKGIAYSKKTGDVIDTSKITKKFILSSLDIPNNLLEVFSNVSTETIDVTHAIVEYAKEKLSIELVDSIYISIMDHINASVERYAEGIQLKNKLMWEIKHFYKSEYEIGLYALDLIEESFGIRMEEDEACFIALHVISAEIEDDFDKVYEITGFIQDILNIVKYNFNLDLDTTTLQYQRFVTHLKFFGRRVFFGSTLNSAPTSNDILEVMKSNYKEAYACALKIEEFMMKKYSYQLDDDETLYLTIHIAKLTQGQQNRGGI